MGKQMKFYRILCGSRQVVKGNNPFFQLFLQVILTQGASEVTLGKQVAQAVF